MAEVKTTSPAAAGQGAQVQLPLAISLRDDATWDNFLALPAQGAAVRALATSLEPGGDTALYLHGPSGSGKSHLLQACCQASPLQAQYLPLAELRRFPAQEVLQDISASALVCLDDLQAVAGDDAWELALFTLYNDCRERGGRLVVSGDAPPRGLALHLEDLRSRLSWGAVYQLPRADDEDKAAILQFRAARRGMSLSPAVASFIVSRAPRGLDQLLTLLDELDRASLAQQRVLSIPFVKHLLGW